MDISLRPLRREDAHAIVAAEDDATVRFLSGGRSTVQGTEEYVDRLHREASEGRSKRAFGIWADGTCVGTVDYDPQVTDGLEPGDVNIAYGVAPWIRGRGVAVRAVELVCGIIAERGVGRRVAIRASAENPASRRVAEKAGFVFSHEMRSATDVDETGQPEMFRVFVLRL
ncbi:GNAT family N-acetyltransferase [Brachybacterium halotolerans subsp. kimchii]|uniref:GNAT family N-acetyltransferase n=1 Tax=Brachybacterium halotolerans TaxID=2795215 RepID=UPI001E622D8F|nr:GNAT family N-acetyltransferase [Brachybacterium halotolerans]UEJ84266.1 GNAT family N-acetyltransferase [Brachybacterium halotolerans subsp. kimchii]